MLSPCHEAMERATHGDAAGGLLLLRARHQPGLVHALLRHARQFRHPCAHIAPVQVIVLGPRQRQLQFPAVLALTGSACRQISCRSQPSLLDEDLLASTKQGLVCLQSTRAGRAGRMKRVAP